MKPLLPFLLLLPVLAPAAAPNIVFFFTDDQTTSTIGCYGNDVIQTPEIDRLAAEGVRFDNAFVSQPICWVSRTTVLTGLTGRSYGSEAKREVARADAVDVLVSDRLRDAGYRTGFFGKWHAKMPKGYKASDHFDVFEAVRRDPYFKKLEDGTLRHETDYIIDHGIDFLDDQPADQPFALFLWFNATHGNDDDISPGMGHFPWPQGQNGKYEDWEPAPPVLADKDDFESLPDFLQRGVGRERYYWRWNTPDKYRVNMRAHYRMTSGVDAAVGRMREALKARGLAENTIVVYTADNGYALANRGLAGKWTHYEESLRVPMIIHDPRLQDTAGQVVEQPVLNLDLPATFMHWAGKPVPGTFQGESLVPLLENDPKASWRTHTFHEHFALRRVLAAFEGVRTERYKYARYVDHDYEFLHDLETDPLEKVNLAGDPAHAETLANLRALTAADVARYGGPLEPLQTPLIEATVPYPEASASVFLFEDADPEGYHPLMTRRFRRAWRCDRTHWDVRRHVITGHHDGTLKQNDFVHWWGGNIRNFDLKVSVKISAGGNSGIQYRSNLLPDIGIHAVGGYQCDIVPGNRAYDGMVYEEQGRGILTEAFRKSVRRADGSTEVLEKFEPRTFDPDTWHEYRIRVEGHRHRHWIDGTLVVDFTDEDLEHRVDDGILAFQLHRGKPMEVQFKEIRIKLLPDELPVPQS